MRNPSVHLEASMTVSADAIELDFAGSLSTLRVTAPEGSILNAPRPAAVAVRHVTGQMLPDLVLGCLEQALPGRTPAEGSSSLWKPVLSGGHGMLGDSDYGAATPFSLTVFHSGGTGARPGKDGLSATARPSGLGPEGRERAILAR